MRTLEYHYVAKESWGPGEWQDEPDKRQWQDEATGLPCLIVRGPAGALCGYVGVATGHPKYYANYNEVPVDVHGGLTFAGPCVEDGKEEGICHVVEPGEDDRVWWLGFDCCHMNDYAPLTEAKFKELGMEWPLVDAMFAKTYKTFSYVENEVRGLALQLAALKVSLTK